MTPLIHQGRPSRWKVFRVLPVAGQNDGRVEPLLITPGHFRAFVDRHAPRASDGFAPIAECNGAMTASYLMVDPLGRFFDNVDGRLRYSRLLGVGVEQALADLRFCPTKLEARGGIYTGRDE